MARPLLACAALVVIAGCGGSAPRPTAKPTAKPAPTPVSLVVFQRNGGLAATLDRLTVHGDGTASLDKRYGGAGRRTERLRLRAGVLAELRARVAALPARLPATGRGTPKGATYLVTVGRRTVGVAEGAVPAGVGRLVTLLNAIVDGDGRVAAK